MRKRPPSNHSNVVLPGTWLDDERVGAGLLLGALLVLSGVYVGALRPAQLSRPRTKGRLTAEGPSTRKAAQRERLSGK
jgi:hypothetical protein